MNIQFFLIGMAHFVDSTSGRGWVQNIATAFYAIASSSGSIFFALNFGDEGKIIIPISTFVAAMLTSIKEVPPSKHGSIEPVSSKEPNKHMSSPFGTGARPSPKQPPPVSPKSILSSIRGS